ncbi:MAG: cation transporter [Pseudohongiellaceae bacterium]|nr:cation transporter [Pseudohongiellaceae bacterium]
MSNQEIDVISSDKRRAFWTVLVLNALLAAGFLFVGLVADSSSLLANGLDNTSDAAVYGLSLLALSQTRAWKRAAAKVSGTMLLIFSVLVFIDAVRRFFTGSDPIGQSMIIMAIIAAAINLVSLYLLKRLEGKDVNLRAAITFSFNDFIANGGIIVAGVLIFMTGDNWPDLLVGAAVACIAAYGGIEILKDAHMDKHEEEGSTHYPGD